MDGAKFSKLCRDCKLLSRAFTTIDVDLIFAKAKIKGQRKVRQTGVYGLMPTLNASSIIHR